MSSLAGALDQPTNYNHGFDTERPPANQEGFADEDVDMNPPSTDIPPKEEDNVMTISPPLEDKIQDDEEMEDLFGNEADDAKTDAKSDSAPAVTPAESGFESDDLSQTEKEHRRAMEYLEPEEPGVVVEQVREANVPIPNIPVPTSSDGEHWAIRMPNFVKVDSKPFHPDTYVGPEHEDDDVHHNESIREKSMSIKLKVENTMRWRWTKDEFGQDIRQSNSRLIRWSDGTLSLRLGKELFDITQTVDTSGGVVRQSLGSSQASQSSQGQTPASQNTLSSSRSQGLTYLVAQHKRSEVLQAEAVITGYMTLRPTGMQSETHRMLVRAVGQKHNKVARLRMAPDPTVDPEREKMELMKQSARKSKKKTDDSGLSARKKRYSQSRKRQGHDIWSEDEEEPEYEGSEDDDDLGGSKRKEGEQKKRGPGEYQEDDFVVADESDDDAEFIDGEAKSEKKRKRPVVEEEEVDPLDQLDAKIKQREQDERKRKHQDTGNAGGTGETGEDGGDLDMDIESEEEEEEHRVRKAGAGARKKRTVTFDNDDNDEE